MKLQFNLTYFAWTIFLFLVEVAIAMFIHDEWIRPFFGDFLVVILLYCGLKTFLKISVTNAIIIVFIFSYLIEIFQYFNYVEMFGLQNNKLASVIMGTHFAWLDLLMYTLGLVTVAIIEKIIDRKRGLSV